MDSFIKDNYNYILYGGIVLLLIVVYLMYKGKKTEGFRGSAPSVVLFTGKYSCGHCGSMQCPICVFRTLKPDYGNIKTMHVPDVHHDPELNLSITNLVNERGYLIAYLVEGLDNLNIVQIYEGVPERNAIEQWIISLPLGRR